MTTWLKQSTAAEIPLGPFVDSTDGVTAETALTITQAEVRLKKNAGDWAQKAETTSLAHEENGHYRCLLDTTDTDTLGRLRVAVNESGALPVWADFMVVPANVWDSFFGADKLDVNVEEWNATAVPAEHTAGYPVVTVKDGAGAGEIVTAAGLVKASVKQWDDVAVVAPNFPGTPVVDVGLYNGGAPPAVSGGNYPVNLKTVDGSGTAVANIKAHYDGTGFGEILVRTTIATLASQTSFTLVGGSADNDAYNGCVIVIQDGTTAAQKAVAVVLDYVGATKTVTLLNDHAIFTVAAGDIVTIIASRALKASVDNRNLVVAADGSLAKGTGVTGFNDVSAADVNAQADLALADYDPPTNAELVSEINSVQSDIAALSIPTAGAIADAVLDEDMTLHQTQGSLGQAIGDPGADADTLWGLVNTNLDAAISSRLAAAGYTAPPSAATIMAAILDEAVASHVTAGTVGERIERLDIIASGGAGGLTNARAVLLDNADAAISTRATPAQVNTEVLDVLNVDTFAEPAAVPAATASLVAKIGWMAACARNKITQTATTLLVRNDADAATIGTSTVSDDSTTFTRGKFS